MITEKKEIKKMLNPRGAYKKRLETPEAVIHQLASLNTPTRPPPLLRLLPGALRGQAVSAANSISSGGSRRVPPHRRRRLQPRPSLADDRQVSNNNNNNSDDYDDNRVKCYNL